MPRKVRKPVHFEFEVHGGAQQYSKSSPKRKTRTILVEIPRGFHGQLETHNLIGFKSTDDFDRSFEKHISTALKQGKIVVAGETAKIRQELKHLKKSNKRKRWLNRIMVDYPSLQNIKNYYEAEADFNRFRHRLIIRTVKESEKPIEARYGSAHSILTKELKEQGIQSSREIIPQVFGWHSIVTRKLLLGKTPTSAEYKRAFISGETPDEMMEGIARKKVEVINSKDYRFADLVYTTLLSNLKEEQLDRIIREKNYSLIFTLNGFPNPEKTEIPRKAFIDFLNKHSSFWRRQQSIARRKKEAKKRKN